MSEALPIALRVRFVQAGHSGQTEAMTDYRRNRVPGGVYFFTVNLAERRGGLLVRHIGILRDTVRRVRASKPFHIDARVVLPEHMHCLWTLPEGDTDFSGRWQAIKTEFSRHLPPGEYRSASRIGKGERGIWQRRFWEHAIRDDRDYAAHRNTFTSILSGMGW